MIDTLLGELFTYNPDSGEVKHKTKRGSARPGDVLKEIDKDGYLRTQVTINKKRLVIRVHRLAWFLHYGHWPSGVIYHINGLRTDNRAENMRDCSHGQNLMNRSEPANNTSGVKGVSWSERDQAWVAYLTINGHRIHLGQSKDKNKAVDIRHAGTDKYHGEYGKK